MINSYSVLLEDKNNNNLNQQKLMPNFPYMISNLTPYTTYNMTIFHRNKKYFSKKVLTLEGGEI